ncbi:MAG TPA: substrate-binding domain-containing protein [Syntrophorhabdaceae bacterium]|jgi:phosphate transport system substrate-binding protein
MIYIFEKSIFLRISPVIALFLCLGAVSVAPAEELLRIGGVGSPTGMMKLMSRAYERAHPGIGITIYPSLGSAGAVKALAKGAIDVGMMSRELDQEERRMDLTVIPAARTPFIFVAHKSVGVSTLSPNQIAAMYGGKTISWPDGKRVRPVLRPASDTDTAIAKRIAPEIARSLEEVAARPGMLMALTDQDLTDMVESTPGAFGFSSLTLVLTERPKVKVLAYNGVKASLKSIANGSYPLWKPFYIVLRKDAPPAVHDFVKFVKSPEGKRIMESSGNLPD